MNYSYIYHKATYLATARYLGGPHPVQYLHFRILMDPGIPIEKLPLFLRWPKSMKSPQAPGRTLEIVRTSWLGRAEKSTGSSCEHEPVVKTC